MFIFANTTQKNNCIFRIFGTWCQKMNASHALLWSIRDKMVCVAEHHNAPPVDGGEPACVC
jgi:hypothetical protein